MKLGELLNKSAKEMLNEVKIELGGEKPLLVFNGALQTNKTKDKSGALDTTRTKIGDANKELSLESKKAVNNVINYLKQKGILNKVASKQNLETPDLNFNAIGDCIVSFDDGGSIKIPAKIINTPLQTQSQKKSFLNSLKQTFANN